MRERPAMSTSRSSISSFAPAARRSIRSLIWLHPTDRAAGWRRDPCLLLEERKQVGIHSVLQRGAHPVRSALVNFQPRTRDELGGQHGRWTDGHDLIVIPVQD